MKENETTDLSILKGFCLLEPSTVLLLAGLSGYALSSRRICWCHVGRSGHSAWLLMGLGWCQAMRWTLNW